MAFTDNTPKICEDNQPFISLLKLTGLVLTAYFISAFLTLLIMRVMGVEAASLLELLDSKTNSPEIKNALLISQAITSILTFLCAPLFYIYFFEKKTIDSLNVPGKMSSTPFMLTLFIVLASFIPLSLTIEWNKSVVFPEVIENWAREKESLAEKLTQSFLTFSSFYDFLVAFVIIAVLAGVSEEVLFRGLLQNKFFSWFKNIHIAILVSSILFSAIHFQFYGFIPRMLLGMLFGYLYYWSKNILIPIFAHFVNNGFQVLALYLYKLRYHEFDVENTSDVSLTTGGIGLIICSALLFSLWKYYSGQRVLQ